MGLAVAQLVPPRTSFLTLLRDPLKSRVGDEQSILTTRLAFTTDEAIQVGIDAATAGQPIVLVIQETPDSGSPRLLTLDDGGTSTSILPGLNNVVIDVARDTASTGSHAFSRIPDERRSTDRQPRVDGDPSEHERPRPANSAGQPDGGSHRRKPANAAAPRWGLLHGQAGTQFMPGARAQMIRTHPAVAKVDADGL